MALIGFVLAGKPPSATSSASSISDWIASNHFSLEVADYLTGLLLLPLIVFASGIRIRLEEAGYRTLGLTAFAGALLIGSLLAIELLVGATLVLLRTRLSDGAIVALYGLEIYATVALPFLVALFVGSIGLAGLQGAFRRNAGLAGLLVAAFQLVAAAANFSTTGLFSPEGGVAVAGYGLFLLWVLAASIILITRPKGSLTAPRGGSKSRLGS